MVCGCRQYAKLVLCGGLVKAARVLVSDSVRCRKEDDRRGWLGEDSDLTKFGMLRLGQSAGTWVFKYILRTLDQTTIAVLG